MDDETTDEDWLEGATVEAVASDLTFFSGQCIELDPSRLPDPPGMV